MRVLFLDDESWRWEVFGEVFPEAFWAQTADQAIRWLETQEFDLICLDHDLASPRASGMQVVDYLVRRGTAVKNVWVHSWNVGAAPRMAGRLGASGVCGQLLRVPFSRDTVEQLRGIFEGPEHTARGTLS